MSILERIAPEDPWMASMRRGDFDAAWRVADRTLFERAGRPCWHLPRHFQYLWSGRPLGGRRVLVHCYHGLGDTIQFARYLPRLKAVASDVIVWAQPSLLPLLRSAGGIDLLLPLHDGDPGVERDEDVELMELPHYFRSTLATLPRDVPYLHVEPSDLGNFNFERARLNVGLVWQSGAWDDRRSVPVSLLQPLLDLPGVHWVVLQNGIRSVPGKTTACTCLGEHTVETAARTMRGLDLVITVDTLAAHLAGALAVPTWTLLQAEPDWRWMREREDSPWYPTMRLFRQRRAGDWEDVITRVVAALEQRMNSPIHLGGDDEPRTCTRC